MSSVKLVFDDIREKSWAADAREDESHLPLFLDEESRFELEEIVSVDLYDVDVLRIDRAMKQLGPPMIIIHESI